MACGGLTIDHALGLSDVCTPPAFLTPYRDLCSSESSSSSATLPQDFGSDSLGVVSQSSEFIACVDLPLCVSFDDETSPFTVKNGAFAFEGHDSPGEVCGRMQGGLLGLGSGSSASISVPVDFAFTAIAGYTRNVAILTDCPLNSSLDKTCIVELQMTRLAPQRNGGIVVNWHIVNPLTAPRVQYYLVLLNQNLGKLQILRFNGMGYVLEVESGIVPLHLDDWYRLEVTTSLLSPTQVAIHAELSGVTDGGFSTVTLSLATTKYLPADGYFGVGSNYGHTRFSFFQLQEA